MSGRDQILESVRRQLKRGAAVGDRAKALGPG